MASPLQRHLMIFIGLLPKYVYVFYFLVFFALDCNAFSTCTNEGPAFTMSSTSLIAGRYADTTEPGMLLPDNARSMKRFSATMFEPPTRYLYRARSLPCVEMSGTLILGSLSCTLPVSRFLSEANFSRYSMISALLNFALAA